MLKRDDPTLKMYDLINFSQLTDPKYSKYQTSARISLDRSLAIVKDIEEEKVSTTSSGLLARTNSKMSKDVNKDEPLDRVTRYVHTIRNKRNEMKND